MVTEFYPVGQGLFHACRGRGYSLVYDCGTRSAQGDKILERALGLLREELDGQKVGHLVISHFDKDHISGVVRLSAEIGVHTVVLPELSPVQTLYIAATQGLGVRTAAEFRAYVDVLTGQHWNAGVDVVWASPDGLVLHPPGRESWCFRLLPRLPVVTDAIRERLRAALQEWRGTPAGGQIDDKAVLREIADQIRDDDSFARIRQIFRGAGLQRHVGNRASVQCLYGPASGKKWQVLLTGDGTMDADTLREMTNAWGAAALKNVLIVQVPHHGSRASWNQGKLLELLRNSGMEWVISAGSRQKAHPDCGVVHQLKECGQIIHVHEKSGVARWQHCQSLRAGGPGMPEFEVRKWSCNNSSVESSGPL